MLPVVFADRYEAGAELAKWLKHYAGLDDVVVLALPRGGVPVAFEVAEALGAPLDVFIVRKLGMPGRSEYAIGAIASGGVRVLNQEVVRGARIDPRVVDALTRDELTELQRRERVYRQGPPLPLQGRIAILVDDGLATGSTMKAAVQAVRHHGPSRIVVAAPVGAASTCSELGTVADEVVCARTPEPFTAVGLWYCDFAQTGDDEVRALLRQRAERLLETN
jgi:putative phosphoribosyl transferase